MTLENGKAHREVAFPGSHLFLLLVALILLPFIAPARTAESYLYIEDSEVRHELLLPLSALESLAPVHHDNAETITLNEQSATRESALALLDSMNTVSIDGIAVASLGGKVVFFDKDVTAITGDPPPRDLATQRTLVGVILRYETKGPPQRVALHWTAINEVMPSVRATVYAGKDQRTAMLSKANQDLTWVREGAAPQPELANVPPPASGGLLSSAPAVSQEDAAAINSALLRNIYRAFDYRQESQIYDALERSVSGEMLTRLYLNLRRGLEIEAEGGPVARVLGVEIVDGKLAPPAATADQFHYDCGWTVLASVEHWGHVHTRKNLYRARYEFAVVDGAWKIRGMQVSKQERLETKLVRRGS